MKAGFSIDLSFNTKLIGRSPQYTNNTNINNNNDISNKFLMREILYTLHNTQTKHNIKMKTTVKKKLKKSWEVGGGGRGNSLTSDFVF